MSSRATAVARQDFHASTKLFSKPFKTQVVQECLQPGATFSGAISQCHSANVIRKWLPLYRDDTPAGLPGFNPLRMEPSRYAKTSATIELPLG
jgi:transposase